MEKQTTENLLEQSAGKPAGLPDKFWDEASSSVRLKELIADYNYMASRDENLVETNLRGVPSRFEDYQIQSPSPVLELDDDIRRRFFEKHFTNEQAQLVYDLAAERVLPVLGEMGINFEAERQLEKLASYFGGKEKFNEVSRQISAWAKQNVRAEVYDALATTADGVIALYKMMSGSEPALGKESLKEEELSEASLRKMMEDPRYWRDKDSAYIAQITRGFEKLYPEK